LSHLPHSLPHSKPASQGELLTGTVTAETLPASSDFPRASPKIQVAGGPRYLPCLFSLPCLPPEAGKSSAPALNTHLLLKPLFPQEQLCHQLPTAQIHGQPKAFPFHRGIASSRCRWEWGQGMECSCEAKHCSEPKNSCRASDLRQLS